MTGPGDEVAQLLRDFGEDWEIHPLAGGALIAVRLPRIPGEGSLTADGPAQLREKLNAAQAGPEARLRAAAATIARALQQHGGIRTGPEGIEVTDGFPAVPHSWVEMALRDRWYQIWITEL